MYTTPHPLTVGARPPSRRLAVAAAVLVWIAAAPGPLAVFASSFTVGSSWSTDTAQLGFALLTGGLLGTQLATAVAGVVVIVWLWQAWAHAAARAPQRWSQAWVIAAWFVPVLNLWVPAVIVTDIARASLHPADPAAGRVRAAVVFWWAGWLGAWAALIGFPLFTPADLGSLYRGFALFTGLSALLSIVSATAFTVLVLRITGRQATAAPGAGLPVAGAPDAAGGGPTTPVAAPATPWAPAAPAAPRRSTPRWLVPAVLGGVVVLLAGAGLTLVVTADDPPAEVVAAAVEDAREWSGANYRGSAPVPGGEPVEFDITVTGTGARGTLTRGSGRARAEVVQDGTGVLIKGNREWWEHSYPQRAEQLADRWMSDAGTETVVVDHILRLDPAGLEDEVHPELGSLWEQTGEREVDGQPAIVLSSGILILVVTAEEPYRLLSIEYTTGPGQESEPVRVTVVDPAQAAEVDEAAARVRSTASPRTLTQQLLLRPQADIQVRPEPLCSTPTCTASFTATNTGEIRITGRFVMTANGVAAGSGRVDLRPGESATFNGSAPNPIWGSPGARGDIYWEGRIIPD